MLGIDTAIYNIFGGYTPEADSVDRDSDNITYELKSIVPDKDALDELLEISSMLQKNMRR